MPNANYLCVYRQPTNTKQHTYYAWYKYTVVIVNMDSPILSLFRSRIPVIKSEMRNDAKRFYS